MPPDKNCALSNTAKEVLHNAALPTSAERANIVKADQLTIRLSENQTALLGPLPSRVMEGAADRPLEALGWTTFSGLYGGAQLLFYLVLSIYGCSLHRDLDSISLGFRRCGVTSSAGTAVGEALSGVWRCMFAVLACSNANNHGLPAESSGIP